MEFSVSNRKTPAFNMAGRDSSMWSIFPPDLKLGEANGNRSDLWRDDVNPNDDLRRYGYPQVVQRDIRLFDVHSGSLKYYFRSLPESKDPSKFGLLKEHEGFVEVLNGYNYTDKEDAFKSVFVSLFVEYEAREIRHVYDIHTVYYAGYIIQGLEISVSRTQNVADVIGKTLLDQPLNSGDDYFDGSIHADLIKSGDGADRIRGSDGNDNLFGEAGDDNITGGAGNDQLIGGVGQDILAGDAGADRYVFNTLRDTAVGATRDQVTFSRRDGDKIDLFTIDADTDGMANNQAFKWVDKADLAAAFTGVDGQVRFADGILSGDVNGDRQADFEIRVIGSLMAGDLIL